MNGPDQPSGSVIIPAWNEERVIGRTIDSLFRGIEPGCLEVIVVCNGCTDDTAGVVQSSAHPVTLVELTTAGKAAALRAGDQLANTSARLYLDADCQLPGTAALAVADALASGSVAARPPVVFDLSRASWPVRSYYAVREHLPSVSGDLCGAGVYGLGASARSRFGAFPDVVADDLFAARIVDRDEVSIIDCAPVVIKPPTDARSLTTTLARVYRGNRELAQTLQGRAASTTWQTARELVPLIRRPRMWPHLLTYVALVAVGRARSHRGDSAWERDESSRSAEVSTA